MDFKNVFFYIFFILVEVACDRIWWVEVGWGGEGEERGIGGKGMGC